MEYKTVRGFAEAQLVEKKSRFIGYINHAASEDEAWGFLTSIRQKHRDATHNVYAYVIKENNINKFSDDGEPAKTAGAPVLDVINGCGLTNVIIVVTRYFGGTLLGTGGLVKAYQQSAKLAVEAAKVVTMTESVRGVMTLHYTYWGKLEKLLSERDCINEDIQFANDISVSFICRKNSFDSLREEIINLTNGNVVPEATDSFFYGF